MSAPILAGEGIVMDFRGLRALNGVDFQVEEGSVTAIIGPNGAGKTTLFNIIAGDQRPSQGRVRFQGQVVSGLPPNRICRLGISRTYQSVRPFLKLSVRDNVRVALLYGRRVALPQEQVEEKVAELLDFVQLGSAPRRKAEALIPLERKRLEIARALGTEPRLLLLDEIVAGLSPVEGLEMMETIRAINRRGITVLLIEHVMKAVMGLSDHVIVLHHGEKIAEGAPGEITQDPKVVSAYLGDSSLAGA